MTMEWQPIESAPKDGTRILLWTDTEAGDYELLRYITDVCEGEHFSECQIGWFGDKWEHYRIGEPTHLMPLPEAPRP